MRQPKGPRDRGVVALTILSLLFSEAVPIAFSAQSTPPAPAAEANEADVDGGWPRAFTMPKGGTVVIHQPQVASWEGQKHVVAYSAVAYTAPKAAKADLGSIKLESDTDVSLEERRVDVDRTVGYAYVLVRDVDRVLQCAAQLVKRMAQRLASTVLVSLTP